MIRILSCISKIREKSGHRKKIHPQIFRHSMATMLSKEGQNSSIISAQFGQRSLAITDRYIQKIEPLEQVNTMGSRSS